jgi:regulator of sigma E protease
MTLIVFIIILSILVLIHEFGHFIVAKKLGIRVEEFGLGLPPRLFGKKIGETMYSLNALPFGGFVKVTGEDLGDAPSLEALASDTRSFMSRNPWQRIAVLLAGVFMNVVLAVSLFYIVLSSVGFKTSYMPVLFDYTFSFGDVNTINTVVTSVEPASPAAKAGIQVGEAILSINRTPVANIIDVRTLLKPYLDRDVSVLLVDLRDGSGGVTRVVVLRPQADSQGNPILGVYLSKAVSLTYAKPRQKMLAGFMHSYNVLGYSINSLGSLFKLSFENKSLAPVSQSVSGPVGIYNIVGGVLSYGGKHVVTNLLDFIALMSLSLAFMNLLPIPALDGGRAAFVVLELIRGKKVSPRLEGALHKVGFMLLFGLLILITIKDIFR